MELDLGKVRLGLSDRFRINVVPDIPGFGEKILNGEECTVSTGRIQDGLTLFNGVPQPSGDGLHVFVRSVVAAQQDLPPAVKMI